MDAHGNAMAVWQRWTEPEREAIVEAAWRPAESGWSAPARLSLSRGAAEPQVALDARGNAVAVWQRMTEPPPIGSNEPGSAHAFIQASVRPVGGRWSRPQALSPARRDAFHPQLAVDRQGNAVAVWQATTESASEGSSEPRTSVVQAAHRPAGGSWSAPQDLSRGAATGSNIAVDPQGSAVAVWWRAHRAPNPSGIYTVEAARRRVGAGWSAPERIGQASTGIGYPSPPQVAVDSEGNAAAVWVGRPHRDGSGVQAALRPVDRKWSAPKELAGSRGEIELPKIALNGQGHGVAVWRTKRRPCAVCTQLVPVVQAAALRPVAFPQRAGANRSSRRAASRRSPTASRTSARQRPPAAARDETGMGTLAAVLSITAVLVLAALGAMIQQKRRQRRPVQARQDP